MPIFKRNGFDVYVNMAGQVYLKAIPVLNGRTMGRVEFEELLFMVGDKPACDTLRCSKVKTILASKACRSAHMIGDPLNMRDMRLVLDQMSETVHPWNCPHGRPSVRWLHRLN